MLPQACYITKLCQWIQPIYIKIQDSFSPLGGGVDLPKGARPDCTPAAENSSFHHTPVSIHPPLDTSLSAGSFILSLTSCCISAATLQLLRYHFQVCKCKILPTGSYYLFSWSNRVHVSLSVQSVGLTCLCSSRSALFPTRIIGNSSLSFTRRICLWNL